MGPGGLADILDRGEGGAMNNAQVLVLRHVRCEGPGLLGDLMAGKKIGFQILDVGLETEWPKPESFQAIVALGGPQSVYEEDKFPYLVPEDRFIRKALELKI